MLKRVVGACIVAACLAFLFVPGLFDMIFALVFVGVIPFTNATIPPVIMMFVYAALIIVGMYYLAQQSITSANPVKREEAGRKRARKKVYQKTHANSASSTASRPKKRYQPVIEH